jgi:signal transduction histidine kinase
VIQDATDRKQAEAERERLAVTEALAAERQALLKRIVQVQEAERASISREIHDSVTQLAHAAAIHLDNAVELLDGTPAPARAELERGRELTRAVASEARRLIAGLRPETLDILGLAGAVQQEVDALRVAGWRVDVDDAELACVRLNPEAEITLFRVAQEALSNVRKHAGRARVRVRLNRTNGSVRLEVRDWGRGFDPKMVTASSGGEHVGLVGMRERMDLAGGRLEVRSSPESGTTIRARLPISGRDEL